MFARSANKRGSTPHGEPPMRVRPEILDLCRERIEPQWKRAARNLLHRHKVWTSGVHAAGEGVQFGPNSRVKGAWFGNFSSFGHSAAFNGPVVVGDLTMLSSQVEVIGNDHVASDPAVPMRVNFPDTPRPVTIIEADCWIGARVTIMEGVRIGRGSIVGAGCVVTKSIPPYSVVAGVPGRVIRQRFDEEATRAHDLLLYGEVIQEAGNSGVCNERSA
jgi:acetyltransferase-like isoleucine patch superfamily enzyme